MNEKRFKIVKGVDNNINKEAYFIQDTYKGHILGGSYWKEEWAEKDCNFINVLQNRCEIMNQRLSEKSKCNYKEAIIEFCKFMNINTPLLEVMVDEFLQEVF